VTGPEAARRLLASPVLRRLPAAWPSGRLFLTGGSLRDRLLRVPTRDLDLAVLGDARDAAQSIARVLGGRCFPLGRQPLVTWRVVAPERTLDLWGVAGDVEHDILRRDFTVNAIFWRLPRGPLIDLVGGLDDLAAGRIRVVRQENLEADPLRVLRAVRLLATHPRLRLTAESERQLAAAAPLLRHVARERIAEELSTMLSGAAAERSLAAGHRLGVLAALVPEWRGYGHGATAARVAGELAALEASRGALAAGAREVAPAVVAAPAGGWPEAWDEAGAANALVRVGWPPRRARRVAGGASLGELLLPLLVRERGRAREPAMERFELLPLGLAWALAHAQSRADDVRAAAVDLLRDARRFAGRAPLLSGDEVARLLGLAPGPAVGDAVCALNAARVRGEVRTRAGAVKYLLERAFH
jgi:hypothetical protein